MTSTTIAAAPATMLWAVVDRAGRVVVIFAGGEAGAEARRWQARGYRIARLSDD